MNAWDGPRRARPDEFGEAMRFTDLVFRPGQTGRRIVQRQYPHAYREGAAFSRHPRQVSRADAGGIHPGRRIQGQARRRA